MPEPVAPRCGERCYFHRPSVTAFRQRQCRRRRHPAPRLRRQRAGHAVTACRTTLFTADFWNVRHICTAADSNGRVSVAAAGCSAGQWFGDDGRGAALAINIGSRPTPRHDCGDGPDAPAVSIAVTALRTGIGPNAEAGADLARRIPVAVCIRFAPARPAAAMTRSGCCKWLVSLCKCIVLQPSHGVTVCRGKAPTLSGCESRPATVAPAGSNRSGLWR